VSPRRATSFDPAHWKDPDELDPDRYNSVPTCHQIDEAKCEQIGFAKCPFDRTKFDVTDGRKASGLSMASSTISRCPFAIMLVSPRSGLDIGAAPASS